MTDKEILSAYTGWKRADRIYQDFHNAVQSMDGGIDYTLLIQSYGIYLFLFHALLFSVLEFLKEHNAIPQFISDDVEIVYDPLRRFRNAVFHLQDDYPSHKYLDIVKLPQSRERVEKVHSEIGRMLENEYTIRFLTKHKED